MNKPKLACPFCFQLSWVVEFKHINMCYCSKCKKKASKEFFQLEGEKWNNAETVNAL